jgi:hypothetical protein
MTERPAFRDLSWNGNRLMVGRKWSGIQIIPDANYPDTMWRIEHPPGTLSDMVNRARAKDAAIRFVLSGHAAELRR